MLLLILKSSACLAVFMLFYKLFLEKESIHHFKRFYLLGALLVSIIIPLITFTQYIEVEPIQGFVPFEPLEFSTTESVIPKATTWQDYIPTVLWSIYFIGVALFSFRFALNLRAIFRRIRTNPKHQYRGFTNVLIPDLIHPHTFFKYIFLNKRKYEHNLIPNEVLLHEQTHAKQKHALDILCVEVLQIIFWFNPLLYFIKKYIKLNHEFLADQAVLQKGIDATQYKQTLLAFSSKGNETPLANAINYSLIKKRFTVMKSNTSKQAFWLRSLVLLPLFILLLYGFSEKKVIEKEVNSISSFEETKVNNEIKIYINKKEDALLNGRPILFTSLSKELKQYVKKYLEDLSKTKVFVEIEGEATLKLLQKIKDQVQTSGLKIYELKANYIKIDEKKFEDKYDTFYKGTQFTADSIVLKTKKGEKIIGVSHEDTTLKKAVQKYNGKILNYQKEQKHHVKPDQDQIKKYNTMAKKYNAIPINKRNIPLKDLKALEIIYMKMSQEQRQNNQSFPECLPEKTQDGASRKLMAEYDKLAKHYNKMPRNKMKILKKDVEQLKYIYGLMSDKQKASAEPFPDFPEPPPPPKAPNAAKVKKGEKSNIPPPPSPPSNLSDEAFAEKVIDKTIANQDPYDHSNYKYTIINRQVNKEWTVSSGANRDSRTSNDQLPIPPVAPTIAIHANTNNYSKELKTAISKYLEKNKAYEESIEAYSKKGKGNRQELWGSYNEAMELYVAYYDLARKEDNFVQPMPPIAPRVLKGEVSEIPTPPTPPEPKSPLDHIIEMAKEGAIFYYGDKKISLKKAKEIVSTEKHMGISTYHINKAISVKLFTEDPTNLSKAKSPLDHVIEIAKGDAKFYYNDSEISSDKAIRLLKKNKELTVSTRYENNINVVKLYTKPILIKN